MPPDRVALEAAEFPHRDKAVEPLDRIALELETLAVALDRAVRQLDMVLSWVAEKKSVADSVDSAVGCATVLPKVETMVVVTAVLA